MRRSNTVYIPNIPRNGHAEVKSDYLSLWKLIFSAHSLFINCGEVQSSDTSIWAFLILTFKLPNFSVPSANQVWNQLRYAEIERSVGALGLRYLVWMFSQAEISHFDLNKPYLAKNKRKRRDMCILRVLCDTFQDKASYTQMSPLDKHIISCCYIIIKALPYSALIRHCPGYVTGRSRGH